MSKERLEEIKSRIKSGFGCLRHFLRDALDPNDKCVVEDIELLESDIGYLIKQAELGISQQEQFHDYQTQNLRLQKRVLELEHKLYQDHRQEVLEGLYEQNKRYREAVEEAINDLENECLWDALIKLKALEGEE